MIESLSLRSVLIEVIQLLDEVLHLLDEIETKPCMPGKMILREHELTRKINKIVEQLESKNGS